jgi:asparagine synthase (glutamine-hydrolysing)
MCGICGVYGLEDRALLNNMTSLLEHRGPDGEGTYIDNDLMLGHRRLAIIDLVTGDQPIYNEDRSLVIVHTGEVYNFPELRRELKRKGHKFYTKTDTEVILHAYEEYGDECVSHFNGMFAFAIWDSNKKLLFLARDRNGLKPLYYTITKDGTFLFASEIKSILRYEPFKREVDLQSFHYYLNLRYLPRDRTMFKGIKKLLPAHIMKVRKGGKVQLKEFWSAKIRPLAKSEDYFAKKLFKILERSVERHMISDVPIAILLSGGIDSSTIVAMASRVAERLGAENVRTFCMGFGEATDEMEDARVVSDHFNTDHRDLVVKANVLKDYPKMIWHMDSPKRNLYPYYLSELVSKYVKVALGGLGGDELFGGYPWKYIYAEDVKKLRKKVPTRDRAALIKNAKSILKFQATQGVLDDDRYIEYLKKLRYLDSNVDLYLQIQTLDEVIYGKKLNRAKLDDVSKAFEPYFNNKGNFLNQIYLADYKVKMVDDFIFVDDGMAMAHSLESRVPFLDHELVEFAFTIPNEYKYRNGISKYLFKKVASSLLPPKVLKKPKQGFGTDVFLTFKWELYEFAKQKLPNGNLLRNGFIKKEYLDKILSHSPQPYLVKHYCLMWSLLGFEIWYDMYINNDDIVHPQFDINKYV